MLVSWHLQINLQYDLVLVAWQLEIDLFRETDDADFKGRHLLQKFGSAGLCNLQAIDTFGNWTAEILEPHWK